MRCNLRSLRGKSISSEEFYLVPDSPIISDNLAVGVGNPDVSFVSTETYRIVLMNPLPILEAPISRKACFEQGIYPDFVTFPVRSDNRDRS